MMKASSSSIALPRLLEGFRAVSAQNLAPTLNPLLLHTFHSTAIDGARLTLAQMTVLIQTGSPVDELCTTDQLLSLNYHQSLEQILALATQREPLNRLLIQQLAANVMRQTGGLLYSLLTTIDTSKGDLRIDNALAGRRGLVDAHKLPSALADLLKDINTRITQLKTPRQIYDLSFQAHFQLLSLHPFGAGNGRVARLLMNYIQQYHGLPLSLVYTDDRQSYFEALATSWRQQTSVPIVNFLHNQLRRYLEEVIERAEAV